MIKVEIKKQNVVTNTAKFDNQELAEAWYQEEYLNGSFGKIDRWVLPENFDAGESIETATNTREALGVIGDAATEYFFPKEHTVEYVDVTAQLQAEQESRDALKYLAETDYVVLKILEEDIAGNQAQVNALKAQYADVLTNRGLARPKVIG